MDAVNGPPRCLIGTVVAAGSDHQLAFGIPHRKLVRVEPVVPNRPVGVNGSGPVTGLTLELEYRNGLDLHSQ